MFTNQAQLVLYVEDVQAAADFWQAIGFSVLSLENMDGSLVAEIAPTADSPLTFTLYDKNFVEAHAQNINTSAPQIMFYAENILALYQKMQSLSIQLGELIQLEDRYVFNFVDMDGNYFAVTGQE